LVYTVSIYAYFTHLSQSNTPKQKLDCILIKLTHSV